MPSGISACHGDERHDFDRLIGAPAPTLRLFFALEGTLNLAQLARRRSLAVFFYHDDLERARAWADQEGELEIRGWIPVAISAETPEAQARFARRDLLGYFLLSDPKLELARILSLPTKQIPEERVYEPLTLMIHHERIARVFYPINPTTELTEVMRWIGQHHDV